MAPAHGARTVFGMEFIAYAKKAAVAFVAFLVSVASAALAVGGVIPVEYLPYIQLFLLVAGTKGVYDVRNASKLTDAEMLAAHRREVARLQAGL